MANRPKPTAIKELEGNPGKRALAKREPKPEQLASTVPPQWLDERATEAWKALSPMLLKLNVLTEADAPALIMLCDAWSEWRRARDVVVRSGFSYTSKTEDGAVMIKTRPEVRIAADAWRRTRLMMVEFGLTPASRSKVAAAVPEEKDPFEEYLS